MTAHDFVSVWADELPGALQEPVDPSISLLEGARWRLPAGWVSIVNRLHADLAVLLGDYRLVEVSQKAGGLRFRTTPIARGEAAERIRRAAEESWTTCEVCGEPGTRTMSSTRCEKHSFDQSHAVPGVIARPPGTPRQ